MKVEIFDVDHGACALITLINQHVLLDCGHRAGATDKAENTLSQLMVDSVLGAAPASVSGIVAALGLVPSPMSAMTLAGLNAPNSLSGLLTAVAAPQTGWCPSTELERRGIQTIDKLIVSNADEDHLSDLPNIYGKIFIAELMTNPTMSAQQLRMMKLWSPGPGTRALLRLMEEDQHTFRPRHILGDIQHFWVVNGAKGIKDTNNLSVVTFVSWGRLCMIFPGDIEGPAWELLMLNNEFLRYLRQVNVFVASHHGRWNGYYPEVFRNGHCSPVLVVISDKEIKHGTQESMSATYGNVASGCWINGDFRRVLTTRRDGRITFLVNENGQASVYLG